MKWKKEIARGAGTYEYVSSEDCVNAVIQHGHARKDWWWQVNATYGIYCVSAHAHAATIAEAKLMCESAALTVRAGIEAIKEDAE